MTRIPLRVILLAIVSVRPRSSEAVRRSEERRRGVPAV